VFVRPAEPGAAGRVEPTLYSRPNDEGEQIFELAIDVPRGLEHLDEWVPPMAEILINARWQRWWLDSFSISTVLDRSLTRALKEWGERFWPRFQLDALVLIQVGLQREAVNQSVADWQKQFDHLRYDHEHDFDQMEMQRQQQSRARSKKIKSILWPKFLGAKHRAQ
jgi:hypothetical protein